MDILGNFVPWNVNDFKEPISGIAVTEKRIEEIRTLFLRDILDSVERQYAV